MSRLNNLKNELKIIITSDINLCIGKLREAINTASPKANEITIIEGRLNEIDRQLYQGLIAFVSNQIKTRGFRQNHIWT